MRTQRRLASHRGERGFLTLIGLLVVIVIIGIMLAMYAGPGGEGGGLSLPATCPVGEEPYDYDPTTGQIHCVHPGHERY